MAIPDVIENCNSASLNSQVSAVSCALDQLNKKFGSGSLKILQDGYVDITMGSLTDNYSSPWTVECWFYPTAVGSADGWLFNQDDNTDGSLAWYVRLKASSITLGVRGLTEISAVIIAYNEWHHLRVTHAGDKLLKLYLDGALLGSKTFATETDPRIRFGKPYTFTTDDKNRWYTGNIDEIAFTVLDSSNVAEYSGDTAPVPTEGYPDEGTSGGTGVVINGLFLSTSKPTAGDKGLLINNKFFIPFAESSGGTSAEYYKCASVDVSAKTWTGYKAVFDSGTGTWSFKSDVTAGLAYTSVTPVVGNIYSADALVIVSLLYTGTPTLTSPTGMTSGSSDEWEISASGNDGTYYPWKAFDGKTTPTNLCWKGNSGSSWWIQWQNKQKQVLVQRLKIIGADTTDLNPVLAFTLQGSDDGSTWSDIYTASGLSWMTDSESKEFTFANSKSYYYHRLANITATNYPAIIELETYDM